MAHDSKYKKVSGDCCDRTTACKSNVDNLGDLKSLTLSEHVASKNKLSKAGKHKGSYLYTKRK